MPRKGVPCAGTCGKLLTGGKDSLPAGQRCCRECRARKPKLAIARVRVPARQRFCEVCEQQYKATYSKQRTCGRDCGWALRVREGNVPQKAEPKPATIATSTCLECAVEFTYTYMERSRRRRFCSSTCGTSFHTRAGNHARSSLIDRADRPCKRCGKTFAQPPVGRGRPRLFCSGICRKRASRESAPSYEHRNHRKRARHFGVAYEPISKAYILERDRWKCGICSKRIYKQHTYPHPMSPSLDHVVPMSQGGGHVLANVQASHWLCNSLKSDGLVSKGEQLMLIG